MVLPLGGADACGGARSVGTDISRVRTASIVVKEVLPWLWIGHFIGAATLSAWDLSST
jgi:hypothetical protein